jgi:signal transduction histidine kinase
MLAGWEFWMLRNNSTVPSHLYRLQARQQGEWEAIGGEWVFANGGIYNNSYERGAKLLTGSSAWKNYTLTADVSFTGTNADMGVVVRVNDAQHGVDTYNGYFVGLRTLDGTMVVGRSDFGWREARPVVVPGGIQPLTWYRLRVTVYECNLAASAQNLTTGQTAWVAFQESYCVKNGRIGLRSLNTGGMWRNISIAPADWNNYQELGRHAASVEHPEILPGPPWWTPWHATILSGSILALVLVAQLIYFRMQQWKTYTIARERERVAHDIHDTMAQSFAGIGYQIQGIYHNILRGVPANSSDIAEQLRVAYQLVRRCHEEASRTIAMLGSPQPYTKENLLDTLAETARKIAGDQITTIIKLRGKSTRLDLRLADALLHIGREAIVNAVSHADPTMLRITLNCRSNLVELAVEDNGQGFEFTPENSGFGILGMQKRARDVGAVLSILSRPWHGTRVRVTAEMQHRKLFMRMLARIKKRFTSA